MLLLLGPVQTTHPSSIGGTTKSFGLLTGYLASVGMAFRVIPTNRWQGRASTLWNGLYVLVALMLRLPFARAVMLNANPRGAVVLGPLVWAFSRLWRRPFVFRMFGGDLIEVYEGQRPAVRELLRRTVLQADLVLLQTRRLISYFDALAPRLAWLPNARAPHPVRRPSGPYGRRLLYLGAIRETKGIEHILRFRREHGDTHVVDLYGPIVDARYQTLTDAEGYRGVVAPDEVVELMARYDVLLLPTWHAGEGYPGVVIEANSVGLPVVASRWLAIPELIEDDVTGRLVPPGDYDALAAAIVALDESTYRRWSSAALRHGQRYDSTAVFGRVLNQIDEAVEARERAGRPRPGV